MLKTTAFAPMANASVRIATIVKPGDFAQQAKAEAHILQQRLEKMSARRFVRLLPVSLVAAELDARAPLRFRAGQAGALQIIRAMLDVRAKLLFHLRILR